MFKLLFLFALSPILFLVSCNNDSSTGSSSEKATADTLYHEVMEGHNVGMAKSMRLEGAQKQVQSLLDSIGKLPAKAQQAAGVAKARLDSVMKQLQYADFAMEKWMKEFNWDSSSNDLKVRIKYLTEEKLKINKVNNAILDGLGRADSAIRAKF
jgi:hypothetical protein